MKKMQLQWEMKAEPDTSTVRCDCSRWIKMWVSPRLVKKDESLPRRQTKEKSKHRLRGCVLSWSEISHSTDRGPNCDIFATQDFGRSDSNKIACCSNVKRWPSKPNIVTLCVLQLCWSVYYTLYCTEALLLYRKCLSHTPCWEPCDYHVSLCSMNQQWATLMQVCERRTVRQRPWFNYGQQQAMSSWLAFMCWKKKNKQRL